MLTADQIEEQISRPEGEPPRTAIEFKTLVPNSKDLLLLARRSGDQQRVLFRAFSRGDHFEIHVYPKTGNVATNPIKVLDSDPTGKESEPLEVMISNEVGAGMPMTGDYDLFAVCPSWAQYGSLTAAPIVKPGIALMNGSLQKGLSFPAGVGMDNVMDQRLQTMGQTGGVTKDFTARQADMRAKMAAGTTASSPPIVSRTTSMQRRGWSMGIWAT